MKKIFLLSLFALLLSLTPLSALAVEYGGIGGRPANPREDNPRSESIFIYELEPGESFDDGVEVFNNTESERTVEIHAVDSILASDGAFSCAQNVEAKVDVGKWISLSRDTVTIPAGQSEVVDFTVRAPEDASVGEHSGCIAMQDSEKQNNPDQSGVVLTFRSAIRVAVTIPGDIIKAITVSNVSLTPNKEKATTYIIQPSLTNTGNVSLDTEITSRLVSILGTTVDSETNTYPVLPGSTARWNIEVDKPFWGGWYRAVVDATYNANTEEGLGETSNQDKVTSSGSSSLVFVTPSPLALAIEGIILLVVAVLAFLLIRKLRHKKVVKQHWTSHTVKEGESLHSLAKDHHTSWKKIATANNIRAPYHLEPGTKVKVPAKKSG